MIGALDHRTRVARARAAVDGYRRYVHAEPSAPPIPFVRIFGRIGPGCAASAGNVERILNEYPNTKLLELVIDSPGGDFYDAQKIYALLRGFPGFVTARVLGRCSSAASIILLSAGWREGTANSQYLLHGAEVPLDAADFRWDAIRHQQAADVLRQTTGWLVSFYSGRTGLPRAPFDDVVRNETRLTARQAKDLKLIHAITGEDLAWA